MSQSSTASGGFTDWISSHAFSPSGAVTVVWPALSRTRDTSSRPTASSSATTIGARNTLMPSCRAGASGPSGQDGPPREARPEDTGRREAEPRGSSGVASLRIVDDDGDAAVARIERVVGDAWPAVGVAAHGVHLVGCQAALLHRAARGVGPVGRELPVAVAGAPGERAAVGVPFERQLVGNLAELGGDHREQLLRIGVQLGAADLEKALVGGVDELDAQPLAGHLDVHAVLDLREIG